MTDEQIIKSLGCLIHDNCEDCQYYRDDCTERIKDPRELSDYALGLIIRQQGEIDGLRDDLQRVCAERDVRTLTNKFVKSEAVKEFANRLKEVSSEMVMMCDNGTPISISYSISSKKLDSILKEMVGDEK